jgi:hypothetical protein
MALTSGVCLAVEVLLAVVCSDLSVDQGLAQE